MTLKWYSEFHLAWAQKPPVDWLIAAFLKYEAPKDYRAKLTAAPKKDMEEMVQMIRQLGGSFSF